MLLCTSCFYFLPVCFYLLQILSCPENFGTLTLPKFSPDTHFVSQNASLPTARLSG
jgi:hypothetical protein